MITLGESGVCNACLAWDKRAHVDWDARRREFEKIVTRARSKPDGYDCLIPVSGGKDSFWQVITCLEYGLNPLTVTWRDPSRLPLGQENLEALVKIGVDHIDQWINPEVEQRFMRLSFERYAVPGIPKHMGLYNIPLKFACKFHIPLIVWGENDAIEYGNIDGELGDGVDVDYEWLMKHGITQGTSAEDWVGEDFTSKELSAYFPPSREELQRNPVRGIYLGYFFQWDPVETWKIASEYGFRAPESGPGWHVFDDVDSEFISIHHYLKWHKFGVTRLFDNLSIDIRAGRISREEAITVIAQRAPERPDADIAAYCAYLDIDVSEFDEACEKFRNPDIWCRRNGVWVMDNFIVEDWEGWNERCD